jgi:hypothetical protein
MEYLMTYGWAILIIAIGVATLSALGIFNGGSGSTNGCSTQPNFSCTNPIYSTNGIIATISQDSGQEYYDSWVFVASAAQELGGNGLPQNMSTANMVNTGELPSSQPETFYFVSNTETTAGGIPTTNIPVGTQFTGSIWLAYCTVPGCSSPTGYAKVGTVSAKEEGTTAGFGGGSSTSITSTSSTSSTSTSTTTSTTTSSTTTSIQYLAITLSNSQSTPTQPGFQQMITIDSASYSGINGLWSNVEFTSGNSVNSPDNTILDTWCESGCTGSSTDTVVWVNLGSTTVPSDGNAVIYMNFMPGNIMNTTCQAGGNPETSPSTCATGEAPQLFGSPYMQSSYAQYDNGQLVFPSFYDNFAGISIDASKWSVEPNTNINVANGVTFSASSATCPGGAINSNSNFSQGTTMDFYGTPASDNGNSYSASGFGYQFDWGCTGYYGVGQGSGGSPPYVLATSFDGSTNTGYSRQSGVWTLGSYGTSTSTVYTLFNYGSEYSVSGSSSISPNYISFAEQANGNGPFSMQWVRVRDTPPNGVMPTPSFGAVV